MSRMKSELTYVFRDTFTELVGCRPSTEDLYGFVWSMLEYGQRVDETAALVNYFEQKWGRPTSLEEIQEAYKFQQAVSDEKTLVQTEMDGN